MITVFRGLPVDTWFDIFMQYALLLAAYDSGSSSYEILAAAKNLVIFQDPKKLEIMKYVNLCMCTCLLVHLIFANNL